MRKHELVGVVILPARGGLKRVKPDLVPPRRGTVSPVILYLQHSGEMVPSGYDITGDLPRGGGGGGGGEGVPIHHDAVSVFVHAMI